MKKLLCLLLLFLIACSNHESEPMITKEEPQEPVEELLEKEEITDIPQEKQNLEIEFILKDEIITLNTKNITILGSFLKTVKNKQSAIANMELKKLELDRLYLLSFNCSEDTCSYLLLDRNEPNRSFLIDDLAYIKEINYSPEESKLLFIIETYHTDTYKVFHLEDWTPKSYEPKLPEENIRIENAMWLDEETIKLEYLLRSDNTSHEMTLRQSQKALFD
ncbi:hypothetical protein [Gracilibacillus kekensis]|uniref:Uncharacterized protein n=1 Tax=Gracilibacillus kekensis TaxID=1027249 RepID=A0A1M7ME24_9BACI|nr:hypothetical protein [Gracilibacillus kekensis]SHM89102.1 hypothetical protein SAMN05216179_1179 [Gracilibacillus kekensis]